MYKADFYLPVLQNTKYFNLFKGLPYCWDTFNKYSCLGLLLLAGNLLFLTIIYHPSCTEQIITS